MNVIASGDWVVIADFDKLATAVGAHALRVSPLGDVEGLILGPESAGWLSVQDMDLVQPVGATRRARNN